MWLSSHSNKASFLTWQRSGSDLSARSEQQSDADWRRDFCNLRSNHAVRLSSRRRSAGPFAQLETLDLARRSPRQFVAKLDPTGIVGVKALGGALRELRYKPVFNVRTQCSKHFLTRHTALFEHDESL